MKNVNIQKVNAILDVLYNNDDFNKRVESLYLWHWDNGKADISTQLNEIINEAVVENNESNDENIVLSVYDKAAILDELVVECENFK